MAWRELDYGDRHWLVSLAAERRPDSAAWVLAFSFRAAGPDRIALWASYPFQSPSKAALFTQAERISTEDLLGLLAAELTRRNGDQSLPA